MSQRRNLDQALFRDTLNEAATAFLAGETSQEPRKIEVLNPSAAQTEDEITPTGPSAKNPVGGTISLTFRAPSELATRLLEISLARKLRREKPFTQQDIIAEALQHWLKNIGKAI